MEPYPPAVHHTIVLTDIENFTDPDRTNLDQLATRQALYEIIEQAFATARIDWAACRTEDRGDGVFTLIPSDVPKALLATNMLSQLARVLAAYNVHRPARTGIRLRVAMHAGEVHHDPHGVTGCAVNHAFRLVEAPAIKAGLKASAGHLAVIVSEWFYDEVVRHYPAAQPRSYRRVRVATGSRRAWIRLSPDEAADGRRRRLIRSGSTGEGSSLVQVETVER